MPNQICTTLTHWARMEMDFVIEDDFFSQKTGQLLLKLIHELLMLQMISKF